MKARTAIVVSAIVVGGCTTQYVEFEGECVMQQWRLAGYAMRSRTICDLPSPGPLETQVRDREAMDVNPFPDLFERDNADSLDPDLLEKEMGIIPEDE